jgi:hypothetical protein
MANHDRPKPAWPDSLARTRTSFPDSREGGAAPPAAPTLEPAVFPGSLRLVARRLGAGTMDSLRVLVVILMILGACFGLSCLVYLHLAAVCEAPKVEPLSDMWDGPLP